MRGMKVLHANYEPLEGGGVKRVSRREDSDAFSLLSYCLRLRPVAHSHVHSSLCPLGDGFLRSETEIIK